LRKLGHNLRKNCTTIPHTYASVGVKPCDLIEHLYMPLHRNWKAKERAAAFAVPAVHRERHRFEGSPVNSGHCSEVQNRENWKMLLVDCGSCTQPPWMSECDLMSLALTVMTAVWRRNKSNIIHLFIHWFIIHSFIHYSFLHSI